MPNLNQHRGLGFRGAQKFRVWGLGLGFSVIGYRGGGWGYLGMCGIEGFRRIEALLKGDVGVLKGCRYDIHV